MTHSEKMAIESACTDYNDVFFIEGDKLAYTDVTQHRIKLHPDTRPINTKQYRLPYLQREEVEKQLKQMEQDGIIEPSESPWNSPIILVKKKVGKTGKQKFRLVLDFGKLNEVTETQKFPIPLIDEILDDLKGMKYFSTMDLHGAYHQVLLHKDDRDYTAFSSGRFKYRWVRMPMGLKTAPFTWQRTMNIIFRDMIGKGVHVFFDDLLISSRNLKEHIMILREVFKRLRRHNLKLKVEKCNFFKREIKYLGHVVSKDGCKADPEKFESINNFPRPKSVVEVQRFVGMCNYYKRYKTLQKSQKHCTTSIEKIKHSFGPKHAQKHSRN